MGRRMFGPRRRPRPHGTMSCCRIWSKGTQPENLDLNDQTPVVRAAELKIDPTYRNPLPAIASGP